MQPREANIDKPVPLVRRFCPVAGSDADSDEYEFRSFLEYPDCKTWEELDSEYRSVILAEAGAGKTFEMRARARHLEQQGVPAFFIRIEDIDEAFENAFEVGSAELFAQWLDSQGEAWFYLDSVDEARLDNPTTFEKAIRRFSAKISPARWRAHVCISSRPHAWRAKSDRELVLGHLPFRKPKAELRSKDPHPVELTEDRRDALEVLVLQPLVENDIRLFACHRSAHDIDGLIRQLERADLMPLAGRPFDLDEILHTWNAHRALGGRTEILRHSIDRRLGELDPDRADRQRLDPDRARSGARALAAAVVLTGKASIRVPDRGPLRTGLDAQAVLADWQPREVQDLLAKAVFDDVIYGAVRFRHRDVRELLAAEWFAELLERGHSRHAVETLFFREQYGVKFVSPRLSVVLPWLILDDHEIRARVLAAHPEIVVRGGDPARLPLQDRKGILADIVDRIGSGTDDGTTRDNHAIARIAQPDLTVETQTLIDRHADNDDAVFFLGRLVWQGEMSECVPPLLDIASDPRRGVYARIAAARAVMTCGTDAQKATLWNRMRTTCGLSRELLAELVQDADANTAAVPSLLESIERVVPYERYRATGLTRALHRFIERLPLPSSADSESPLPMLVAGLKKILSRQPFLQANECHVSEAYSWLLQPAIHAVERLVSARAEASMGASALAIMLETPRAWLWHEGGADDYDDYKDGLADLVPAWPELNDCLFWEDIKSARRKLEEEGKRLDDDCSVQSREHYWSFGVDSFDRILDALQLIDLQDDRLVALSLAFRVYQLAEKPAEWLDQLSASIKHDAALATRLDRLLNPPVSEEARRWERWDAARRQQYERRRRQHEQQRLDWVARLKADPSLVRNPPGIEPGGISGDQWWLLTAIEGDGPQTDRTEGANWRSLVEEFGEDVAIAYRDAAIAHWRRYRPGLRSEGADTNSIPGSVVFALVGLAIEAVEVDDFPAHLCASEVRLALRYIVWELNGFPAWLESVHRTRPQAVMEAVEAELFWELARTKSDQPMHYVLSDLANYAPWLHASLFRPLLTWLQGNDPPSVDALRHVLRILTGGCSDPTELLALSRTKATAGGTVEQRPYWYAVWVDAEPDTGVLAVAKWLDGLESEVASHAAQIFVAALMGKRLDEHGGFTVGNLLTPRYLKRLYVLMHRHICVEEDIDHASGRVYRPGLRDHAQETRNALFQLLADTPGKEAHIALTELIEEHPDPRSRSWMARRAYGRAQADGDVESWTEEQVREFGTALTATPVTQRQLFDLTVARVADLKNWLEQGTESPYVIWRNAPDERQIRVQVAGWLILTGGNAFTIAQEPEVANRQRMDIWLQNPDVSSPVTIELKLLDKGWTGPQLCDSLVNQLARDYMRDADGRCGLMLLFWKGTKPGRRWLVDGSLVGVSDLRNALKRHWASMANSFPNVSAIEVLLVDLTVRATKSDRR